MNPTHQEIAQIAREWIGTPYVHQSSSLGFGADCLGLLRGVWRTLYGAEPEIVPAYSMDWSEPQGEERLWRASLRHLTLKALDDACTGDVILFRMRSSSVAKHLGIAGRVGEDASFIHAYSNYGVVESSLSRPWKRRIVARFAFPERNT